MRKRSKKQLEATAFHEAGHAVRAYRYGIKIKSVTIKPDETSLGKMIADGLLKGLRPDIEITPGARNKMEKHIRVSMAGIIAQKLYDRRSVRSHHDDGDRQSALSLLDYLADPGDTDVYEKYWALLEAQTESFLKKPVAWAQVDFVASGLLKMETISGNDLAKMLDLMNYKFETEAAQAEYRALRKAGGQN